MVRNRVAGGRTGRYPERLVEQRGAGSEDPADLPQLGVAGVAAELGEEVAALLQLLVLRAGLVRPGHGLGRDLARGHQLVSLGLFEGLGQGLGLGY